jgi:transcriptional regulator with XRE-family HTH domain
MIADMSTVAEQLRQAREAKNLSVQQVAEITKIRGDHIRALEEGDFNVFAAPVYIRGFVRTYSTLLKLDVPQTMSALEAELGQTSKFAEPPPLSGPPRGVLDLLMLQLSRVDWRKGLLGLIAGLAVVGGVVGYLAWRHYHSTEVKNLKPGVYQPAKGASGDTLPIPQPRH